MSGVAGERALRFVPLLILGGVLLVAAVGLFLVQQRAPSRLAVDLTAMRTMPSAPPPPAGAVRVAVGSMLTPETNFEAYRDLVAYLQTRLGRATVMVQRPSYASVNELLLSGGVDVAFVCSGPYVDLRRKGSVDLLAVPVVKGEVTYASLILSRPDLPVYSFEQLRGHTFAFTDPLSHTGYTFPAWRLYELRETPERFFKATTFTQSHERSIEMVAGGLVDAAAVDNLVYEALRHRRPEIEGRVRIVEESPRFGIPPVVVPRSLDPSLRTRLRSALLSMDVEPEGAKALAKLGVDRFVAGEEASYDSVERMRRDVETAEERSR